MKSIKLLAFTQSIVALVCLLLLIWNVIGSSCDPDVVKSFETVFALLAVYSMNLQTKIPWKDE